MEIKDVVYLIMFTVSCICAVIFSGLSDDVAKMLRGDTDVL